MSVHCLPVTAETHFKSGHFSFSCSYFHICEQHLVLLVFLFLVSLVSYSPVSQSLHVPLSSSLVSKFFLFVFFPFEFEMELCPAKPFSRTLMAFISFRWHPFSRTDLDAALRSWCLASYLHLTSTRKINK